MGSHLPSPACKPKLTITPTTPTMAPIPEPFKWDQSFAVFYQQLDDEHKGLFDGIFAVTGSPGDAGKLAELKSKVAAHFSSRSSSTATSPATTWPDTRPSTPTSSRLLRPWPCPCPEIRS